MKILITKIQKFADSKEKSINRFINHFPFLPTKIRKFLADILYYIILIYIIALGLSIFSTVLKFIMIPAFRFATFSFSLLLIFQILLFLIYYKSLKFLKRKQKNGWQYLYYATWIGLIEGFVFILLNFDLMQLFNFLLNSILIFYLLYQVKQYFKIK